MINYPYAVTGFSVLAVFKMYLPLSLKIVEMELLKQNCYKDTRGC